MTTEPAGSVLSPEDLPALRIEALDPAGTVLAGSRLAPTGGSAAPELVVGPFAVGVSFDRAYAAGLIDVVLSVRTTSPEPFAGHLRLVATVTDAADPWWLIPGLFYGENRPADCERRFPRFEAGADDPAGMVSDHWSFRSDRAATPAAFAWGASGGAMVATEETSAAGPTGVGLAHRGDVAEVHVVFPFREDPVTYYGSATPLPAQSATYSWQPGERASLRVSVATLPADRHAYAPILRTVYERNREPHPVTPWVPVPEAAAIAAEGLVRWHYDPDPGVLLETVGFDREVTGGDGRSVDRQAMHVGWVSGIPWAYALLAHGRRTGSAAAAEAATRVIDFCCANLSPSGTFWGRWERAGGWTQSWTPIRGGLHARTLGEATLFLLRALELDDRASWAAAARSNLDVVRDRQRADGNLGAVHDATDGRVLSWTGAAGLTWIAAFCSAARFDDDGSYLAAAIRAGEYYARFVEREFIHGAPEDVDLAPTSEDGYAAVMAYVALHCRTGEARWLELARRAADWMLTFRYTYNVRFAPRTPLGVYGFATRGADQASPSNQHVHAYGLVCTRELAELSAATGDPHYRERADEALACFRQLLATADGELNSYRGMITERYYQTECFQPKGMVLTLSHAWSAGVLLLACEQVLGLPG
ncbi:beta-L-arabinofuranosidase domain-containing protein [Jiangella anatolica]|uniref:beta-L-arabinofuranosidase domain-containing protein n=1 Tax=Jiangella anatolica TaxID=2670374 RepID=UPI0018F6F609|nr:beta-L-arabinofuranosidase domain-containing protein [Jiangella anatolica]